MKFYECPENISSLFLPGGKLEGAILIESTNAGPLAENCKNAIYYQLPSGEKAAVIKKDKKFAIMTSGENPTKQVCFFLPAILAKKLRTESIRSGTTQTAIIKKSLENYLA